MILAFFYNTRTLSKIEGKDEEENEEIRNATQCFNKQVRSF